MKFIRFWGPVLLWMSVIFAFSQKQKVAVSDSYTVSFLFFKTLHLIEYATLYVLSYRALTNTGATRSAAFLWAFAIVLVWASSDELHQRFVPSREGKPRDVIIDCIGGGIGWITIRNIVPKAPAKLRKLASDWQLH